MKLEKTFFLGLKNGFHYFGQTLGILVNSFLLLIIYSVGIGLPSILAKMIGKQFLDKNYLRGIKSYWSTVENKDRDIKSFLKQF